jgi:hypothetical protein
MDDVQEAILLEANLNALPDNPTEEQILQAVKGFRNVSVPIAMYKILSAGGGGGATPGAVIGTKATATFSDFVDQGGGLGMTPAIYTLVEGEQILFVTTLCTETFDDSGVDEELPLLYVSSAAVAPFGALIGETVAPPSATVAADGCYGLFNGKHWEEIAWFPLQAETPPLDLFFVASSMGFDGTQGSIEAVLYTCKPTT